VLRRPIAVLAATVVALAIAATPGAAGRVAAARTNDPYFPTLGDVSYRVRHYDLALRVDPRAGSLDGTATISATAQRRLTRFRLDLAGLHVSTVTVDGQRSRAVQAQDKLVVSPAHPLASRSAFTVTVRYGGHPTPGLVAGIGIPNGWISDGTTSYTLGEPDAARRWFPANDLPREKATFTFRVTVPTGLTAVANGRLVRQTPAPGAVTAVFEEDAPMAPYLAELVVGDLTVETHPGPVGVVLRNVYARDNQALAAPAVSDTAAMLTFFADRFGPYPFHEYGVVVPDLRTGGFGFESQTLSLLAPDVFSDRVGAGTVLSHELAHQWFGDDVSPATWRDIWLNEGFATYAEWLWEDHALGVPLTVNVDRARRAVDRPGSTSVDDPGVGAMFATVVYQRGALTLDALRHTVGDTTFFTLLRTYVQRYGGRSASTHDLVALAGQVAGRDLTSFFAAWLGPGPLPTP
jgi:aminopeptidase N